GDACADRERLASHPSLVQVVRQVASWEGCLIHHLNIVGRRIAVLALVLNLLALAGCSHSSGGPEQHHRNKATATATSSSTGSPTPTASPTPPAMISGTVTVGGGPVQNATAHLFAVGDTGYGSSPTLLSGTSTLSNGTFGFSLFSCEPANEIVYVSIVIGTSTGTGNNSGLSLLTMLGPCNQIANPTDIAVNEVTTAARSEERRVGKE